MDNPLGFLFGKTTTTAMVVDEPPPVMDNYYFGDGTVHPGDHCFLAMNYAGCLSVQVSQLNR
jgi:hypothetical protein